MNRTAINAAAFLVAFFLMIVAGHATAQIDYSFYSQFDGKGCTRAEACLASETDAIENQTDCSGDGEPDTTTGFLSPQFEFDGTFCQLRRLHKTCSSSNQVYSSVSVYGTHIATQNCTYCPDGQHRVEGECVDICPEGQERNEEGECRRTQEECERLDNEDVQRHWNDERPIGAQYCVQGCIATVYSSGNGASSGYYSDGVNGPQTCDGNEGDGPISTPSPSPTPTATPGPTPTASPTPTPTGSPGPSPSPGGGGDGGGNGGDGGEEGGICDDGECAFSDTPFGDAPGGDDLYQGEYENGVMGVVQDKWPALQQTAFVQGINQFIPDLGGGGCPTLSFDINIPGVANLGTHQIPNLCGILQVVGIIFLLTATFTARALIFGG